ncbi:MAG: hypothetical protein E7425_03480 [Ruminococcaceae bacterium]|nr:hypothetical protein [Oscillospiraceae bacterium]
MDVLVYTRDKTEYERLRSVMEAQAGYINAHRDAMDGRGHPRREFDAVVLAAGDDENMALAAQWRNRHLSTPVVLVMDGEDHQSGAMRLHVFDYLMRPVRDERIAKTMRDMLLFCPNRCRFHLPIREEMTDEI